MGSQSVYPDTGYATDLKNHPKGEPVPSLGNYLDVARQALEELRKERARITVIVDGIVGSAPTGVGEAGGNIPENKRCFMEAMRHLTIDLQDEIVALRETINRIENSL